MKRYIKSVLISILCALLLLGIIAICWDGVIKKSESLPTKASEAEFKSYSTGDIIEFGWYPQTEVTDSTVISKLNELAGDNKDWTSYNYYIGTGYDCDGQMTPSDYMRYKDIMHGSTKYRGVIFDFYRPFHTEYTSSSDYSNQDDNGYTTSTTYWFKYEPIKWRVLDPSTGLILTEAILDSQAYNNYILRESILDQYYDYTCWGDSAKTYYANNYARSSIRQWLNNDFYNTAFSVSQQNIIQTTLDNSAYTTEYSAYDSVSTIDKIFLLSYSDASNNSYGFGSDSSRTAQGSDYAKCQGLWPSTDGTYWRLRSAGSCSDFTCSVRGDGYVDSDYLCNASGTYGGVRVALNINLTSDILQSLVSETGNGSGSGCSDSLGKITSYKTGDIIEFGWYPQTKETDTTIISALTELAGDNTDWTSYNYYTGDDEIDDEPDGQMKPSNYMRYIDVTYKSTKYRGVVFDSYRPCETRLASSIDNSYQDDNGYKTGTVYWFEFEPIKWRVLDPSTGLVLSDAILDSQAHNNIINLTDGAYMGDSAGTYYSNDYPKSYIRQWLNNDFYNTAFLTSQAKFIHTTILDNSAINRNWSKYDSASTKDKVFILSYADALNNDYGFSTNNSKFDATRTAKGSDYAKCQGLYVDSENGNSDWHLRTPGGGSCDVCQVVGGSVYGGCGTDETCFGVRPALILNLTPFNIQ